MEWNTVPRLKLWNYWYLQMSRKHILFLQSHFNVTATSQRKQLNNELSVEMRDHFCFAFFFFFFFSCIKHLLRQTLTCLIPMLRNRKENRLWNDVVQKLFIRYGMMFWTEIEWKDIVDLSSEKESSSYIPTVNFHTSMRIHTVLVGRLFSDNAFNSAQFFCKRTAKVLIRLSVCAGWSGSALNTYVRRHFFRLSLLDVPFLRDQICWPYILRHHVPKILK